MEYHTILNNTNSTENVDSNKLLKSMEEKEAAAKASPTEINAVNDSNNEVEKNPPPPGRDIKNGKRFILALTAFMVITILNWNIPRYQWPWKFLILEKQQPQMLSLPAQLEQYYNLRAAGQDLGKPVMSTFFEPVGGGCCRMTEEGHLNLVKAWEEAWQSWGWDTRVLTEADARKHPRFEELQEKLSPLLVNEYNHRCFWRWLAMSNTFEINGGWMSDYDAFPLLLTGEVGKELMAIEGFKSWSRHVPTLIHADKGSWDLMIDYMIQVISPNLKVDFMTDMFVLLYLYEHYSEDELHITLWENMMYSGAIYKKGEGKDEPGIDCDGANLALAFHLSHYDTEQSINNGLFPEIEGVTEGNVAEGTEKRADAARIMFRDYRENCIMQHTPLDQTA